MNQNLIQLLSRSTAFIVDFTWEVNCTQLYNIYRPITTVQNRRILDDHVVGMVRCDWLFKDGYIIKVYISCDKLGIKSYSSHSVIIQVM